MSKSGQTPKNRRQYFNDGLTSGSVSTNQWKEQFNRDSSRNSKARNVSRQSKKKK